MSWPRKPPIRHYTFGRAVARHVSLRNGRDAPRWPIVFSDGRTAPRPRLLAMAPKKVANFDVDGVACTIKDGLVNVGLNAGWPRELRFPMKVKSAPGTDPLEDAKSKVRAHVKFAALLLHKASASSSASHQTSELPEPPQPASHGKAHHTPVRSADEPQPKKSAATSRSPPRSLAASMATEAGPNSAAANGPAWPGWQQWKQSYPECFFCLRLGTGHEPEFEPDDDIEVVDNRCAVACQRWLYDSGHSFHEDESRYRYQVYSEFAAGIGCRCRCCQRIFDEELCVVGDEDFHWPVQRALFGAALTAAGNPACRLREVLERCDIGQQ